MTIKKIKSAYWYTYMVLSAVVLVTKHRLFRLKKGKVSKAEFLTFMNENARKWADRQIKNTGTKINIYGLDHLPAGNCLFIANHQSYFDIGFFLAYIPQQKGFISKKEVEKVPFLGKYMTDLRCLFIDRGNMKQSMKIILEGIEILKDDYSMVIFPEGTRSLDGKVDPFKAGSFKLATKSGVPIVPVTIDGAMDILKKGEKLINKTTVNFIIHKPIETKDMSKEEMANVHNVVHGIVQDGIGLYPR